MSTNIAFLLSFNLLILSSVVGFAQVNNRSIENVKAFSKVYGYVRYFYPGDEAASIDWDNFAVFGVNSVININSTDSLKAKLNELFLPIAPSIIINQEIDITTAYCKPKGSKARKVTWQYLGFENEYKNSYYKCRTNRPHQKHLAIKKTGVMTIDATKYHNETIKISAKIRLKEGSNGSGYLFLQQQDEGSIIYYNNMFYNPVTKQNAFIFREIEGLVLANAEKIKIGFMLKGAGALEVAEFNVAYFHNNTWVPIDISNKQFIIYRKDTITYSGSTPVSIQLNDTVILEKRIAPFKQTPKQFDCVSDKISDSLFVNMPLVLFGDKEHTYPNSDTVKLNKLKNDICKYKPFDVENLNDRLANVVVMWNIFQHFYPSLEESDLNWDKTLEYGLQNCYSNSTKDSYLMLLRRLLGGFGDSHIYVAGPTVCNYTPPVQCVQIENKLVVSSVLSDDCPLKVGDVLMKINNIEVNVILDSLMNYVSAFSQSGKYRRAIELLLLGEKNSSFNVHVLRNGNEFHSHELKRNINGFDYRFLKQTELNPYYKHIDDSIFYVDFTRIPRDTLKELLPTLQQYKNIIVDFRGYPKLRPDDWIPHLIDKKTSISNLFFTEEIIYPSHSKNKLRSYPDRAFYPKEPTLNSNFIYLINDKAVSAAETYLYYLRELNTSIFVGQPTAGTTGTMTNFTLRGGYSISFTGMLAKEANGELFHGIMPDIKVNTTMEGLKQGEDELMEKAINYIQTKYKR
ncbi:MAG: hypothetical protein KAG64_08190 [Bacteroidales bacterium]|nr:hypothetical protein [Bacteroidales bacterium]